MNAVDVDLPGVERVSVATFLQPNDVIVVECESVLSRDNIAQIKRTVERVWPGHEVMVFESGLRMKIVSR